MAFSVLVEVLNMFARGRKRQVGKQDGVPPITQRAKAELAKGD